MLKSIVFDMGNVLRDFDPMYALNALVEKQEDRTLLLNTIFKSDEWLQRDAGRLSRAQALRIWQSRLPQRLHEAADVVFEKWCEYMPNFDDMTALVKQLHENGYPIYLLSNASDAFETFKHTMDAFPFMDGAIVSYAYGVLKPDERIYRILFETYGLNPEECYFVDDSKANVEAAEELGMRGYCYKEDTEKLIVDMRENAIRI
jgi:haloacid dehalogenase superfamily, subfamily IA, variant 3 with third motif having DD or ED